MMAIALVYRDIKGVKLSAEEGDANMRAIASDLARKAPYALAGTGKIIGYSGLLGAVYPAVARPIESISGSAIAANCANTSVDEPLSLFSIPVGTIGVNSILQIEPLWTFTSSGNNKILKVKIGGITVYSATRTTSVKEAPLIVLANRNSLSAQIQPYDNAYGTAGSTAPSTYSIDFSITNVIEITGQRANSGDMLTLEYFRVLHFIGA